MEYKNERILGVDEAGRGPLAGPVWIAAVRIKDDFEALRKVKDSKEISEPKREELYEKLIKREEVEFASVFSGSEIIDEINILNATKKAMKEAIEKMGGNEKVVIDGNMNLDLNRSYESLPKADEKVLQCGLASIIAKVERDRHMRKMGDKFPGYGFASHKGYPTKSHKKAIREKGPTPIHRKTFNW